MSDSGQSDMERPRGKTLYVGVRERPVLERLLATALSGQVYQVHGDAMTLSYLLQKLVAP